MAFVHSDQPDIDFTAFKRALLRFVTTRYADKPDDLIYKSDIEHIIDTVDFDREYHFCLLQSDQQEFERGEALQDIQDSQISENSIPGDPDPRFQESSDALPPADSLLMKMINKTASIDENAPETVVLNLGDYLDKIDPNNKVDIRNVAHKCLVTKLSRLKINRDTLNSTNDNDDEIEILDAKISNLSNCDKWVERTATKRGAFGRKAADDFDEDKMSSRFTKYKIKLTLKKESKSVAFEPMKSNAEMKRFMNAVRKKIPGVFKPHNFNKLVNNFVSSRADTGWTKKEFLELADECASNFNNKKLEQSIVLHVQNTAGAQVYRSDINFHLLSVAQDMKLNRESCEYFEHIWNKKHQDMIIKNVELLAKKIGKTTGTMIPMNAVEDLGNKFGIPIIISNETNN